MQTILKRGEAAPRVRSAGLSVAIVAGASIAATSSFIVPNPALAACGGASHAAGVHASTGGTHSTTGIAAPSRAGGGGSGSLGCANGSSAAGLRGLPTAASGRVIEAGVVHTARRETPARTAPARQETRARTAPQRTTNATAHLHTVRPAHRG